MHPSGGAASIVVMAFDDVALPEVSGLTVGIVGGTGPQGRGLAYRWARAGQSVLVGSRDARRAERAAAELSALPEVRRPIVGDDNAAVCRAADVVVVAVPWDGHAAVLTGLATELSGRIVVDCVNPLGFDKQGAFAVPVPDGSAAQQAAALLPDSTVTAAFHHVSAVVLADPGIDRVDVDVLVLGEDRDAAAVVQALAGRIDGMRGVFAGRLRNAGQVEAMTANLISINRRYRTHAGLRIGGL